jgi:hypothetical protein
MNVAWHVVPGPVGIASRPVGNGMKGLRTPQLYVNDGSRIWAEPTFNEENCLGRGEPDHTVPYGTAHVCRFPRHCVPATFIKSLRDET